MEAWTSDGRMFLSSFEKLEICLFLFASLELAARRPLLLGVLAFGSDGETPCRGRILI